MGPATDRLLDTVSFPGLALLGAGNFDVSIASVVLQGSTFVGVTNPITLNVTP